MIFSRNSAWTSAFILVLIFSTALGAQQRPEVPRSPEIRKVTSVDELMPYARYYVTTQYRGMVSLMKPSLGAKAGDKILLITEITTDPLVIAAIRNAALEVGAEFNLIELHGYPEITDPVETEVTYVNKRVDQMWPGWIWQAIEQVNIVAVGYGLEVHTTTAEIRKWFADRDIRMIRFPYYTPEMMLLSGVNYPDELFEAISRKVWSQVYGARVIRVTDPLGTDITIRLDPGYWDRKKNAYKNFLTDEAGVIWPGHIMIVPFFSREKASGKLVSDTLHGGHIPETSVLIRDSRYAEVSGEGSFAEYLRDVQHQYKDVTLPGAPGPGADFLMEISIGTQPKASRAPVEDLAGVPRFFGFAEGRKRAGVVHVSFGTPTSQFVEEQSLSNDLLDFLKEKDLIVQHMDAELYHATYTADGRKIVEDGRLLALDDPEIRQIASKYGDPDELLKLDWIPPVRANVATPH